MNLFEPAASQEILLRLDAVKAATPAHWGKMNAAQMMAHCQAPFKVYFGEMPMKQGLIGRLFGSMAKRRLFAPKPWSKNLPTAPEFRIAGEKDFEQEKEKLAGYIHRFSREGHLVSAPVHPFFGKLSAQEWAMLAYRHTDHHLKQFGV